MVLGILDRYMQKMKVDHLLPAHTRVNSKWIKDLNVALTSVAQLVGHYILQSQMPQIRLLVRAHAWVVGLVLG